MPALTAAALAGLLADPVRLRALSAVVLGARTPDEVAVTADVPTREAATALARMQAAGLVVEADGVLGVDTDALAGLARRPADAPGPLAPFVEGDRLRSLPASPGRRREVLAHVAEEALEPGTDYDEAAVNERLASWCDGGEVDHAALRRYLVEQGLVSRGGGVYRLGAGSVEPSPAERAVAAMGLS